MSEWVSSNIIAFHSYSIKLKKFSRSPWDTLCECNTMSRKRMDLLGLAYPRLLEVITQELWKKGSGA